MAGVKSIAVLVVFLVLLSGMIHSFRIFFFLLWMARKIQSFVVNMFHSVLGFPDHPEVMCRSKTLFCMSMKTIFCRVLLYFLYIILIPLDIRAILSMVESKKTE